MHAIELLLDDHEYVTGLFDRVRAGDDGISLFSKIKRAIDLHRHIEETLFFPKLIDEGDDELRNVVETALEDHRQVKASIDELDGIARDAERFRPRLRIVMEDVERLAEEEEERLFALAEEQLDEEALEKLGDDMSRERARFLTASNV